MLSSWNPPLVGGTWWPTWIAGAVSGPRKPRCSSSAFAGTSDALESAWSAARVSPEDPGRALLGPDVFFSLPIPFDLSPVRSPQCTLRGCASVPGGRSSPNAVDLLTGF
jgi:hypothetical protein